MFNNSFYTDVPNKFKKIIIEAQVITLANKIQLIKFKSEIKRADPFVQANDLINDTIFCMKLIVDMRIAASKNDIEKKRFELMKKKIVNPFSFEEAGTGGSDLVLSEKREFEYTKNNLYNKFHEEAYKDVKGHEYDIPNIINHKNNEAK